MKPASGRMHSWPRTAQCLIPGFHRISQVTGGSEGLISWQADVVLPPGDTGGSSRRRLQDSKSASEQGPDSFQLGSIDTFGDSPGRRQLQSFPLPGTRGYPKSAYKCAWLPTSRFNYGDQDLYSAEFS